MLTNGPKRLLRGATGSTIKDKSPAHKRRELILLAALIEHPQVGLILYETGCAEEWEMVSFSSPNPGDNPLLDG